MVWHRYKDHFWRLILFMTIWHLPQAGFGQKPYRGAEYRTRDAYVYGRFEVRMKSAGASGMLASFFTYHDVPNAGPVWNEINIEILGQYTDEIQFTTITPGRAIHSQRVKLKYNPHKAFHIYAYEWTPDYVAWFVDGYEVYRQTGDHIRTLKRPQKIMFNIWPPDYPDWVGRLNPASLPVYAYYDWVKYYAYTPGVGDNFTLQWQDDFATYDQQRWQKATHTWQENNSQFIPENVVHKDGYVVLCLTHPQQIGYRGGAIVDRDVDPPYLVWAHAAQNIVHVYLSEAVEKTSAENTANYTIPAVTVQSARLLPGDRIVELAVDGLNNTQSSVLVVSGLVDQSDSAHKMPVQQTIIANGLALPVKINIGGAPEEGFLADSTWDFYKEYGRVGGLARNRSSNTVISGTDKPAIYRSEAEGLTFYRVRVPRGRYDVTLMMADSKYEKAGERIFDVYAEGQLVFDNLDIIKEAGKNAALEKKLSDFEVSDGILDFYFKSESGSTTLSGLKIEKRLPSGVRGEAPVPREFHLKIYPNPFNPSAKVEYNLNRMGHVKLSLFNINGKWIRTLVDENRNAGRHSDMLDGNGLSTGVYFVSLLIDDKWMQTRKTAFLK